MDEESRLLSLGNQTISNQVDDSDQSHVCTKMNGSIQWPIRHVDDMTRCKVVKSTKV